MTTRKSPEAGNLGAEDDDAGSVIGGTMLPRLTESEAAVVSASPEVLEHHDALHRERCRGDGALTMACSHGTTVLIACTSCHEGVFAAVAPGVPCHHAGEVLGGLRPTGIWTEVTR